MIEGILDVARATMGGSGGVGVMRGNRVQGDRGAGSVPSVAAREAAKAALIATLAGNLSSLQLPAPSIPLSYPDAPAAAGAGGGASSAPAGGAGLGPEKQIITCMWQGDVRGALQVGGWARSRQVGDFIVRPGLSICFVLNEYLSLFLGYTTEAIPVRRRLYVNFHSPIDVLQVAITHDLLNADLVSMSARAGRAVWEATTRLYAMQQVFG